MNLTPLQLATYERLWNDLHSRLQASDASRSTGADPVFYLVFPPSEALLLREQTTIWAQRLELEGWQTLRLSVAELLGHLWKGNQLRSFWLDSDLNGSLDDEAVEAVNQQLREVALGSGALLELLRGRIRAFHDSLPPGAKGLIWVGDLEALHPYGRIGQLEQSLVGQIPLPLVLLYPGTREGTSALSFLGFYPPDGNYRATLIG